MIVLQASTQTLQAVLGGAVATNQLDVTCVFFDQLRQATDSEPRRAHKLTPTNNTTDVAIVAAPGEGIVRNISHVTVFNKDTVSATVTIKIDDGGTEYGQIKRTLPPDGTLEYTSAYGWRV